MEGKGDGEVESWFLSDLLLCPEEQTVAEHTNIDSLPSDSKEVHMTFLMSLNTVHMLQFKQFKVWEMDVMQTWPGFIRYPHQDTEHTTNVFNRQRTNTTEE